jgi:predicted ester cyclase
MAEAENIALYRRLIDEGVGIGRLETLDQVLAPGIELPTVAPVAEPTIAGLKQVNAAFRAGFPDLRATIDEVFANGDWVTARLTWTGTNTGELFGQPPTGKAISAGEIEIVRCENGRIVELRQVIDMVNLVAQLSA